MRFNNVKKSIPNMTSYEGGAVYKKNALEEWMNMLFSDFMEKSFYESADYRCARFWELTNNMIEEYGPHFVAKAAFFARNELGMRSIAQMTAAILNNEQWEYKRKFFHAFPHRTDDIAEVFAAIDLLGHKRSHACVRGFADYLSTLGEYQLGKYKLNNHKYNLYDCINITHANSAVINDYKAGKLITPDTWEVAISTAADKTSRNEQWQRLVEEKKLGYLALIRNINNILNSNINQEWINTILVPQLQNKEAIKRSLVFPYQIYSVYKNIRIRNTAIVAALEKAFRLAVGNLPELSGNTCIILDVSGSMDSPISRKSNITIKEAGAVYAASILLQNPNSDFIKFGNKAKKCNYNILNNIFEIISQMVLNDGCGYGTDVIPAFELLNRYYNRIFLISDMQVMVHSNYWWDQKTSTAESVYKNYCNNYGVAELYSFDLGNYNSQIVNPNNPHVHLCTALNETVLKFISLLENGDSIYNLINKRTYL